MATIKQGAKKAETEIKPAIGLAPAKNLWQGLRRWLGFYTREEREVMTYAKRIKQKTISVTYGGEIMTERPNWMRQEDYIKLRALAKKVERKKHGRK
jgi:hypothetical protein